MITLTGNSGQYTFDDTKESIAAGRKFNHVYKGVDERNNPVLIKKLITSLQNDALAIKRFRNEFDLRVEHPHIISATDYFIASGSHYIIRNWVDGKDLTHTLHKNNLQQSIAICMNVLQALSALHAQHILHLDVQPKNIIIGTGNKVYLADLGLARSINDTGERQPFNIYYSAPEQILNRPHLVNTNTDLFAVGMILLELVNRSKFQSHQNPEILMNLVLASPVVNQKHISEKLFGVISKATSKPRFNLPPTYYDMAELDQMIVASKANRYPDAQAFINDLQRLQPTDLLEKKWWKFW